MVRPSIAPEQQRELDVAHPHPARVGERGGEQEAEAPKRRRSPTARLGWSAVWATSTIAAAGSTIRFGMIRCSASVAEIATRTAQKKRATSGVAA